MTNDIPNAPGSSDDAVPAYLERPEFWTTVRAEGEQARQRVLALLSNALAEDAGAGWATGEEPGSSPPEADGDATEWLDDWLPTHLESLIDQVVRRVIRFVGPEAWDPDATQQLRLEAQSAIGSAWTVVQSRRESFVQSSPIQLRAYLLKYASGIVLTSLRSEQRSQAPSTSTVEPSTVEALGARALVRALRQMAEGAEFNTVAAGMREAGLELSDAELAWEMLRALRRETTPGHAFAPMQAEWLRRRLEPYVDEELLAKLGDNRSDPVDWPSELGR